MSFTNTRRPPGAQNHYNCPIVVSYPENLKNNVDAVTEGGIHYIRPFIAMTDERTAAARLERLCRKPGASPVQKPAGLFTPPGTSSAGRRRTCGPRAGRPSSGWREHRRRGIVLAGRPYHIDPEIHHGIPQLIASYGLAVLTEDSIPVDFTPGGPLRANDQWVYHSRLYTAAEFVRTRKDLELIQLNSFGCGLDAVTTDQVAEILEASGKLYTVLKIDEVSNLGAARIRVRSLLAAMNMRARQGMVPHPQPVPYRRTVYTRQMQQEGWTILAPQMSPHPFLPPAAGVPAPWIPRGNPG